MHQSFRPIRNVLRIWSEHSLKPNVASSHKKIPETSIVFWFACWCPMRCCSNSQTLCSASLWILLLTSMQLCWSKEQDSRGYITYSILNLSPRPFINNGAHVFFERLFISFSGLGRYFRSKLKFQSVRATIHSYCLQTLRSGTKKLLRTLTACKNPCI